MIYFVEFFCGFMSPPFLGWCNFLNEEPQKGTPKHLLEMKKKGI